MVRSQLGPTAPEEYKEDALVWETELEGSGDCGDALELSMEEKGCVCACAACNTSDNSN